MVGRQAFQISTSVYELDLVVAPNRRGHAFRELKNEMHAKFAASRKELHQWFETDVKAHWGIARKCICPIAEQMPNLDVPPPANCELYNGGNGVVMHGAADPKCSACPMSVDMLRLFDNKYSGEVESELGLDVTLTFGTFDYALLWKAPTYIAGAHTRNRIRSLGEAKADLDFVSIPASRIENPDDEKRFGIPASEDDAYSKFVAHDRKRNRIAAYVFLQPKNWDRREGRDRLLQAFFRLRSRHPENRLEAFLTYSTTHPVFVKIEARNDAEARARMWDLYDIEPGNDGLVDESWTVYGLITSQLKNALFPPEQEASSARFLILANLSQHARRGADVATRIAELARAQGLEEDLVHGSPPAVMAGYYDYVFAIRAESSAQMATFVVDHLREAWPDRDARIVTIPLLDKEA